MNSRTPLILGFLSLLAVGFYWFFERNWESTDESIETAKRLFEMEREKVDRVEFQNATHEIELSKKKKKWSLRKPVKYPADQEEIDSLLSELEFLDRVQSFKVKKNDDLKEFGLQKPRQVMRVNWGSDQIELRVGKETPVASRVYVQTQKGSDTVYVIDKAVTEKLDRPTDTWRSKSFADFDKNKVKGIYIKDATREIDLKMDDGTWSLERPVKARAAAAKVDELLTALNDARVSKFVAEDRSDMEAWGLTEDAARVALEQKDSKDQTSFILGSVVKEDPSSVYARESGRKTVVTVSTNLLAAFQKPEDFYRDPRVAEVDINSVSRMAVSSGTNVWTAVLKGAEWRLGGDGSQEANGEEISEYLGKIRDLQAVSFVADAAVDWKPYGLDVPSTTVTLWKKESNDKKELKEVQAAELLFGKADPKNGNNIYARNKAEPFVLAVSKEARDGLALQPWSWKSLVVTKGDAKELTQITRILGTETNVLRRVDGKWSGAENLDQSAVEGLASHLMGLRAERWLGPSKVATLKNADATFKVEGKVSGELQVWRPGTNSSSLAIFKGVTPDVFEIASADIGLLMRPLLLPSPTPAAADKKDKKD